jgi:excisionase family DNA binding protein
MNSETTTSITKTKLAYSVEEIADMTSLSKAFLRNEIRAQKLKAKRFGARVLILVSDWETYAEKRDDWKPSNSISKTN